MVMVMVMVLVMVMVMVMGMVMVIVSAMVEIGAMETVQSAVMGIMFIIVKNAISMTTGVYMVMGDIVDMDTRMQALNIKIASTVCGFLSRHILYT